jgi:CRP/FNR family transcriptional regulator
MGNRPLVDILKDLYLFSFLDSDEIEKLAKICSVHHYKKDSLLFLEGEMSEYIYVIIDGLVSVYKHDDKANKIVIGFFKPFSLVAEAATLKRVPLPSSAMFKSDGSILKIRLDEFEKEFLSQPKIAYEIIQSLLNKIQLLQQNIHFNIISGAKEKILNFYKQNPALGEELKKYEIAVLLGINSATFSRNIKQLVDDGDLKKTIKGYVVK